MRFVYAVGIAVAIACGGCVASNPNAAQPCGITLTIHGGTIADPGPFTCHRNSRVTITVDDADNGDYTVQIDPTVVYDQMNPKNKNPFVERRPASAKPHGGGKDFIHLTVRGNAIVATYKYTVTWSGSLGNGTLDPDIEIAQ